MPNLDFVICEFFVLREMLLFITLCYLFWAVDWW